jgi:hypothetical protein
MAKALLPLFAAALLLAGCQVPERTAPGTVVAVEEARPHHVPEELLKFDDDNLRMPEVAWKVEVQLDDGSHVTAMASGSRRYTPGDRVRLLIDAERALLL